VKVPAVFVGQRGVPEKHMDGVARFVLKLQPSEALERAEQEPVILVRARTFLRSAPPKRQPRCGLGGYNFACSGLQYKFLGKRVLATGKIGCSLTGAASLKRGVMAADFNDLFRARGIEWARGGDPAQG